ncbi:MAG: polyphosphate polymerase domain-containing protein [Bacteroidetes bacterium]|nr:polyphosphate polymerase domain-containing protein [Bacteroidota bacterium]
MSNIIHEIQPIIDTMPPISLEEMDSVKLLVRSDTKYVFPIAKLQALLTDAAKEYSVLHIGGTPYQHYKTVYFDTPENSMYLAHQNKRVNRYKVRHRTYCSTSTEFLEAKFKNNKGITKKKRTQFEFAENLMPADEFLLKYTPFCGNDLVPKTAVECQRITLVNLQNAERVTVDINLRVGRYKQNEVLDFSHICIVELKRDKFAGKSPMLKILRKHKILPTGMSKYAIGTAALHDNIKKNNFKKKLRLIEKYRK